MGCETRALIVADEASIRYNERSLYQRRCRELDRTTELLRKFEKCDAPDFARWVEAEFAKEIATVRAGSHAVYELDSLISAVKRYVQVYRVSLRIAYVKVKAARDAGQEDDLWQSEPDESTGADFETFAEFEKVMAELFGEDDGDAENREEDGAESKNRFWKASSTNTRQRDKSESDRPAENYLKSVYRQLARLLHPDINTTLTLEQNALWHATQDAYAWQDLQRLERILQEVTAGRAPAADFGTIPIFHILDLRRDVEKRLRALKSKLAAARHEVSWNFSALRDDKKRLAQLRYGIAMDLAMDLEMINSERRRNERQIAKWTKPLPPRKKKAHLGKSSRNPTQQPMERHR